MPRDNPGKPINARVPAATFEKLEAICKAGNESRTQTIIAIIDFAYNQIIKNKEKENKGGEANDEMSHMQETE